MNLLHHGSSNGARRPHWPVKTLVLFVYCYDRLPPVQAEGCISSRRYRRVQRIELTVQYRMMTARGMEYNYNELRLREDSHVLLTHLQRCVMSCTYSSE